MEATLSRVEQQAAFKPNVQRNILIRRVFRQPNIVIGSSILLAIGVVTIAGHVIGLKDPIALDIPARFLSPNIHYPFGTDQYGRDVFSRVIWGTRLSINFGLATLMMGSILGIFMGSVAGYLGGIVDTLLSRTVDTIMSFPLILVAIVILSALGVKTSTVVFSIGLVMSPRFARVIRAQVLQTKNLPYIEASRALGAGGIQIFFRHILPNCAGPWIVLATLTLPYAILVESSLSFLGLGVEPDTPTWGRIISDGRPFIQEAPWITIFPGLAITLSTIGFNLLGDGLRDIFDPKTRR